MRTCDEIFFQSVFRQIMYAAPNLFFADHHYNYAPECPGTGRYSRGNYESCAEFLFPAAEGSAGKRISFGSRKSFFRGNITFSLPLRKELPADRQGTDTQGEKGRNMSLNASLRYNPLTYWFIESTFFKYWESEYQAPWDPDFTYSFGYDDWHPYTLSLVYSNYGGNRLHPDKEKGAHFTRFEEGTVSLGWKYTLPRWMEELFIVHSSGGIRGSVNWNVTPRYTDASGSAEEWKQSFSLSMKYTIYEWWYFDVNVFWYPKSGQQQPWDPDYTYGFGFFDWHPGSFSLQYSNYSGNRFASEDRAENTGKFRHGAITASWSWAW